MPILTKADLAQRDRVVDDLRGAKAKLEEALEEYNNIVASELDDLNSVVSEYNAALEAARNFVEDIVNKIDEHIDNKSETWQESERGQAAVDLKSEWEGLMLDEVESFEAESLTFDADHDSDLEAVSTDVS